MRYLLFVLLLLPLPLLAQLQFYYSAGATASFMAQTGPIEAKGLFFGPHQSMGVEIYPSAPSPLQLGLQLQYSFQGYYQQKAGAEYTYRMQYMHIPVYASYPIFKGLRAEAGGYLGGLIRARFVHGNANIGVSENYGPGDSGLLAGLKFLDEGRFGLYLRYQASLSPVVTHQEMAPSGEFTGTIKLLRPQLLMAGLRIYFTKHSIEF